MGNNIKPPESLKATASSQHISLKICAILFTAFCAVLYFSINCTWMGDDLLYQFKFMSEKQPFGNETISFGEPLSTMGDLAESQYNHYLKHNGRSVVHILVQAFCSFFGIKLFSIVNAVVYVVLILLLSSFAQHTSNRFRTIWTSAIMVFVSYQLAMTPVFQINYIWTAAFVLGFIKLFTACKDTRNTLAIIGLSIYSILAGNCHEGINSGVCIALIVYWLSNFHNYTTAQYTMSISFGIGAMFLLLSPGNFLRLDSSDGFSMLHVMFTFLISARAIYILIAVVLYNKFKHKMPFRNMVHDNKYLWIAMGVSFIFAVMTGLKNNRPLLGAELFASVLTVKLLYRHFFSPIFLILFSVYIGIFWIEQYERETTIKHQYQEICEQYPTSINGEVYTSVQMLPKNGLMNSYVENIPLASPSGWQQTAFQKYLMEKYGYDKPLVKVIPDFLYGKDDIEIRNSIIPYGDDVFLLIQSKTSPREFVVDRKFSLGGITLKQYPHMTICFDAPTKENDYWRALVVNKSMFAVMNLTETEFRIKGE